MTQYGYQLSIIDDTGITTSFAEVDSPSDNLVLIGKHNNLVNHPSE
ncbi:MULTISPECIES: hypothetical protein [Photorhabdus]|nr:hypothetical protein [Photorhabdus thracensis]MCC8422726.1 hypothetical protein [Photorhabdus thracensis]